MSSRAAYGQSQPTISVPDETVLAERAPGTGDLDYEKSQLWLDQTDNTLYFLQDNSGASASWTQLGGTNADLNPSSVTTGEVVVTDDGGAVSSGEVSFTNAENGDSLSSGTMTINTTTTNNGSNSGYVKIWIGSTAHWIAVFDDIAPSS